MKRFSLRYSLLSSKLDQLWFPAAFYGLFSIISLMERNAPQFMDIARAYLGVAAPLVAGVLAAYCVLEDPAIELRFAAPISAFQTLAERLGLIFAFETLLVGVFQVQILLLGGQFSMYGSFLRLQFAWMIPTLSLMMLGCLSSLLAANPIIGAMTVGMAWLVELIARGWFAENIFKYALVFMAPLMADHPDLAANCISLILLNSVFFLASLLLLRRQERYI